MDFDYVDDLAKVIAFVSKNYAYQAIPKDVNVVYAEKAFLSEIVDMFIPIEDRHSKVKINNVSKFDYSGNSSTIDSIKSLNFLSSSLKTLLTTYYNQLKIQRGSD
jgi:hypothetical protein